MPALNHLHTYVRSRANKRIYRCDHPQCTSYNNIEELRGKLARCHCGREFQLEKNIKIHFKSAIPKCDYCRGKVVENPAGEIIMDQILSEKPLIVDVILSDKKEPVQLPLEDPKMDEAAFNFEMETVPSEGQGEDDEPF